ncbi:MAG TPA: hypothetical protein VKT81_05515 [Bryobacteraceae bacterium]|nr:hypothetical protein [Bryobacteraceae bacterium]
MRAQLLLTLTAMVAFAADNPWDKVRELKTGTELRIVKKGSKQPILAIMDEANEERLIIVVKNEQKAIEKDDIDRIDFRPATKSKISKETRTTQTDAAQNATAGARPPGTTDGPSTSTSTSFGNAAKPDFQTIYRRTAR